MAAETLQMGAAIDMFVVNAPANVVPKAIVAKLNAFLMGQSINVAEVRQTVLVSYK